MSATCFLISTRACGGGSPRVRSAKKSTCACGASYRHARPHRARAERVSRVCAPQKRVRPRVGRVTGTRAPIAHVQRGFPACALRKKEYVHVWGELPARALPSRTCGEGSPRVRSTKKSTCACGAGCRHAHTPPRTSAGWSPRVRSTKKGTCTGGASCRHTHPHRARAEDVPRVCAPQKRVRARVGRVTGTRTPIVRVRSRLSVRGRGIIYQKRVIFCNILLK